MHQIRAEDQIRDVEDKKANNTQSEQQKEKKIQKMRIYKEPLGQLQVYQPRPHGNARRRREQGIENLCEK